ncbi:MULTISPECIES: ABC transporter permease [unclassified Lactobacillus]|uniref:ABC transporter permease n=1 Tax=unclassified Lactobacillus TaxID=2620435 RepID=UPI0018DB3783|nr:MULTISPECIES: ABC transporter permease [unclassified Lactobacillus]MBH9989243.1 ABC transporter permease [Lactobacillus sp. M0392]MBI0023854.1 ABC transporter permease [Lactobacillus sp. W8171]MBI0044284.1 ABC transporter permease [Lactobacillus sp. M0393]
MLISFKQEIYKLRHENIALYGLIILIVTMIYNFFTNPITSQSLSYGFGAIEWIPLIVITVASAIFSMEYKNNTIIMLEYKTSSKFQIYFSKFLVVLVYSFLLTVIAFLLTLMLSVIFNTGRYDWLAVHNGHTLLNGLLANLAGALIYSFFSIGLSFMLIMLVKNNSVVVCFGIGLAFFGASFSKGLMQTFPHFISTIKWNFLNMTFISQQLSKPSLSLKSNLSSLELIIANIVYGIIFMVLGYYLFKHRRV